MRRFRTFGESSAIAETCGKADTVSARTRVGAYSMLNGLALEHTIPEKKLDAMVGGWARQLSAAGRLNGLR
jgi:hypothetical protein